MTRTLRMLRAFSARVKHYLPQLLLLTACTLCAPAALAGPGGDGHSHGDEVAPAASAASPRVSMPGDSYDVVAIYKNGRLTFYVDRLSDNAPVTQAILEVTSGAQTVQLQASNDGTYVMDAGEIAHGGTHELTVSIQGPDGDDLVAGTIEIPASSAHGHPSHPGLRAWLSSLRSRLGLTGTSSSALPAPVFVGGGLAGGLVIGLLFAQRRRRLAAAIGFLFLIIATSAMAGPGGDGHSHGDEAASVASDAPHRLPDGSVFLPKPTQRLLEVRTQKAERGDIARAATLQARIIANPNRSGIVQSINGGRVSIANGRLPVLGQRVKQGELLALVEPPVNAADETTIANIASEIGQQITLAEVRLKRFESLAAVNAVPRTQVTDLKTELDSLRARQVRLRTQRGQIEELRAPVDGEIALVRAVPGQVIAPQDQLFQIVDPDAMWVEALAFGGFDPAKIASAVAVVPGHKSLELRFQGSGRLLQLSANQLQFAIENPPANLMVGQPARVLAQMGEHVEGFVLPRAAVVRAPNGELVVWQRVASERFMPRPVRAEPVNGEYFVVLAGLEPDQRIVVRGAELINQIR